MSFAARWTFILFITVCALSAWTAPGLAQLNDLGNEDPATSPIYSFNNVPVPLERGAAVEYTLLNFEVHSYEVVYLPEGGLNWTQAKALAQEAGGYLATVHSPSENTFVYGQVAGDRFWSPGDGPQSGSLIGPFLGGFQPQGSPEPDGNWKWANGEFWTQNFWSPDRPNNAGGNANVNAYGGTTEKVLTWTDLSHETSGPNDPSNTQVKGFIIEKFVRQIEGPGSGKD